MKLRFSFIDNEIVFDNSYVNVLEVENKKYFYRIVENLISANEGLSDDIMFFSSENDEISFNNNIKILIDYFNIDFDNKKYITEINKKVTNLLDDSVKNTINVSYKKIYQLMKKVIDEIDVPLIINEQIDIESVIKLLKISINYKNDLLENLLLLIDVEKTLKVNKMLVFINLKQYLTNAELIELYKYAIYNGVIILLVDSQSYGICNEYEKKLIIDNDLDEFVL